MSAGAAAHLRQFDLLSVPTHFVSKASGPSRPERQAISLPERLHVYSNSILISVASLFFCIACTLNTDPKPFSPSPRRFLRMYTLALRMGAWGNHVVSPKKCFCILFASKSMGRSRPKRQAICLPERLHVSSNSIFTWEPTLFLLHRPHPNSDPNPSSRQPRRFLRTHVLALRMGETMWFPHRNVFAYFLRQKVWTGRGPSDMLYPCRSGCTSALLLLDMGTKLFSHRKAPWDISLMRFFPQIIKCRGFPAAFYYLWYLAPANILSARYNCSSSSTRVNWWGKVIGEKESRSRQFFFSSSLSPWEPPMQKAR